MHFRCRMSVFFAHAISKTSAAKITKLDMQNFHDESWKPFLSGSKVMNHKNGVDVGLCTL